MDYEQHLHPFLEAEFKRVGPQLRISAEQMIGDKRVGNFTAPDHIEVLFRLIDPSGHDVRRDPGGTIVRGVPVRARVANYAVTRVIPEPLSGKTVQEIMTQAESELDDLQTRTVQAVNQNHPKAGEYVRSLARFAALYFAADKAPLAASANYAIPFKENVNIRGFFDRLLTLGATTAGIAEIAPGLRGVASIGRLINSGSTITLIDTNPYVASVLKEYTDVMNVKNAEVVEDDAKATRTLEGKGTIIAAGLHHLSDTDIVGIIENIATSMPAEGKLYFRDSEVEKPGMKGVVETGLTHAGLKIEHQATFPQKQGFEFVAGK